MKHDRSDVNIETNHPQLIRELNLNMKLLIPLMQTLVKKKIHTYTHTYISLDRQNRRLYTDGKNKSVLLKT